MTTVHSTYCMRSTLDSLHSCGYYSWAGPPLYVYGNSTQCMRSIYLMVDIHGICRGRVLHVVATVQSTHKVCVRNMNGRHSGDHQSRVGHPPNIHCPFDTRMRSNIIDGRHSCKHQSRAVPPPECYVPLDTVSFNITKSRQWSVVVQWEGVDRVGTRPPAILALVGTRVPLSRCE